MFVARRANASHDLRMLRHRKHWHHYFDVKNPKTIRDCKIHGAVLHYKMKNRKWIRYVCRTCNLDRMRSNRVRSQERASKLKRRIRGRDLIIQSKSKPCADCGIKYPPYVMDFDHLGDKLFNIPANTELSVSKLLSEIAKCDVVCSNCHRQRTFQRNLMRKPVHQWPFGENYQA
jgi:hypothetical protein